MNSREKKGIVSSNETSDETAVAKLRDGTHVKMGIKTAVIMVLQKNPDWLSYPSIANKICESFGMELTREQVRDTCKKLKNKNLIESTVDEISKQIVVKWKVSR